MEREPAGSSVSDLQKINKELEKLQVSDEDSVFSDTPGTVAQENCFGTRSRESRTQSPPVSLNSTTPSPTTHHRAKVRISKRLSAPGGQGFEFNCVFVP